MLFRSKELSAIKKAIGTFPAEAKVRGIELGGVTFNQTKKINNLSEAVGDFYRVLRPDEFGEKFHLGPFAAGEKCTIPKRWVVPNASGQIGIDNYQDLLLNLYRFVDRVVGFFPAQIKVKDTNPAQNGNQSIVLTINSI